MSNEHTALPIAEIMHSKLCDCGSDNCELFNEIVNWLMGGDAEDLTVDDDAADLLAEWNEYTGAQS